jgi:hypothetical protein
MNITITAKTDNDSGNYITLSVIKSLAAMVKQQTMPASHPVFDFITGAKIGVITLSPPPRYENPIIKQYPAEKE